MLPNGMPRPGSIKLQATRVLHTDFQVVVGGPAVAADAAQIVEGDGDQEPPTFIVFHHLDGDVHVYPFTAEQRHALIQMLTGGIILPGGQAG